MDELEGTQISSRDYFKEVCTVSTSTGIKPATCAAAILSASLPGTRQLALGPSCSFILGAVHPHARARSSSVGGKGGAEQHP